jgi:tRNA C32,U32 (ribose-2'-O)-methylase TrmJ
VQRAAGNFRVDSITFTGTRYPRALALNPDLPKMSRSVSKDIPINAVSCLTDNLPENMKIVCIEFAENATSLLDYEHPDSAIYIFGPEDGTLHQRVIDQADDVVYIPTEGCMNLSATCNVVLYDRLAKSSLTFIDNDIIRQSRDRNNNIKVRNLKPIKE